MENKYILSISEGPQVLKKENDPELYNLIELFYKKTGIPLLVNTSLNGKNEPIVETFDDLMRFLQFHQKVKYAIVDARKVLELKNGVLCNE